MVYAIASNISSQSVYSPQYCKHHTHLDKCDIWKLTKRLKFIPLSLCKNYACMQIRPKINQNVFARPVSWSIILDTQSTTNAGSARKYYFFFKKGTYQKPGLENFASQVQMSVCLWAPTWKWVVVFNITHSRRIINKEAIVALRSTPSLIGWGHTQNDPSNIAHC